MSDMSLAALKKDLILSLTDSAEYLDDQLDQLLNIAAIELARFKRRPRNVRLMLQADESVYDAPADLVEFKAHAWGRKQRSMSQPWEPGYPRMLPTVSVTDGNPKQLHLSFAPTAQLIAQLGSVFSFTYYARHTLGDTSEDTTVHPSDRDLLLLRAQAEAMKVLSIRYADKTISSKQMISGAARIGTPAALYKEFLSEFERRAAC
ncbi:MAG: hypothetical protein ACR2PX_00975 [Endozoicomonas sp.]|uniref:phage adaptor protein n=1 Tax=Endozoicomonas sp. TaxID=1892382 RepID=UPI003D9B8BB0